jgi:hypothetical protein
MPINSQASARPKQPGLSIIVNRFPTSIAISSLPMLPLSALQTTHLPTLDGWWRPIDPRGLMSSPDHPNQSITSRLALPRAATRLPGSGSRPGLDAAPLTAPILATCGVLAGLVICALVAASLRPRPRAGSDAGGARRSCWQRLAGRWHAWRGAKTRVRSGVNEDWEIQYESTSATRWTDQPPGEPRRRSLPSRARLGCPRAGSPPAIARETGWEMQSVYLEDRESGIKPGAGIPLAALNGKTETVIMAGREGR